MVCRSPTAPQKEVTALLPCYKSLIAEQKQTGESCGFDSIEMSAGKAPDMSHLDPRASLPVHGA